jgi:hypothetical protein
MGKWGKNDIRRSIICIIHQVYHYDQQIGKNNGCRGLKLEYIMDSAISLYDAVAGFCEQSN